MFNTLKPNICHSILLERCILNTEIQMFSLSKSGWGRAGQLFRCLCSPSQCFVVTTIFYNSSEKSQLAAHHWGWDWSWGMVSSPLQQRKPCLVKKYALNAAPAVQVHLPNLNFRVKDVHICHCLWVSEENYSKLLEHRQLFTAMVFDYIVTMIITYISIICIYIYIYIWIAYKIFQV